MIVALLLALLFLQQPNQQQTRPTDPSDPMPPPNLDYFIGTWSFDWNLPESPLGPGGKLKGTETYRKILGASVYESDLEAEGPQGPVKIRALTSYNEAEKKVTRFEADNSGMSSLKSGPIGGDLGGYYTIFWESSPIKRGNHVVKLKGKTQMLSPAHFRLLVEISVDGGPYTSLGNPWFRKVEAKSASKSGK
jgi:hypothetical protein